MRIYSEVHLCVIFKTDPKSVVTSIGIILLEHGIPVMDEELDGDSLVHIAQLYDVFYRAVFIFIIVEHA